MSARTGQVVTSLFTTANPAIGSAQDADSTPTGTLYLNGAANAAAVVVTNLAAGVYKAVVTMPTLAAGDRVSLAITAVVGGVTGKAVIWGDFGETATASDVYARLGAPAGASVVADIATRLATAGYTAAPIATANASAVRTNLAVELARVDENVSAAKTLTTGERTSIASAVSSLGTTGLAALKALLDAVKLKTDALGTGVVSVVSPVSSSGTWSPIVAGDDYWAGTEAELYVLVSGLSLVGATVLCNIGGTAIGLACTASDLGGGSWKIVIDGLAASQTAVLMPGEYTREFEATWTAPRARKQTFGRGRVTVVAD